VAARGLEAPLISLFLRHYEISQEGSDAGKSERQNDPVISL
jgi:hypothetical protein